MECALIVRGLSRNEGDGVISRGVMFCIGPSIGGADKLGGNARGERSVGQEVDSASNMTKCLIA